VALAPARPRVRSNSTGLISRAHCADAYEVALRSLDATALDRCRRRKRPPRVLNRTEIVHVEIATHHSHLEIIFTLRVLACFDPRGPMESNGGPFSNPLLRSLVVTCSLRQGPRWYPSTIQPNSCAKGTGAASVPSWRHTSNRKYRSPIVGRSTPPPKRNSTQGEGGL